MRRGTARATNPSGSFIYAYCNVRTNQVLYSLERTLQPRHLKQLPDVGANNTPPTLRKDSWRPLFTVSLTQDDIGREQSLYIFRLLREYRKLRETTWKPSPLLSRPYTQEEIDEMSEELEKRGGSKKETVYDIIKRKKWKMRVKAVMDQKANSVADLAAILLEQDEAGQQADERNQEDLKFHKHATVREMLDLARKADKGGLETAERRLKRFQESIETASRKQKSRLYPKIARQELEIKMMRFASTTVADVRKTAQPLLAAAEEEEEQAKKKATDGAEKATKSANEEEERAGEKVDMDGGNGGNSTHTTKSHAALQAASRQLEQRILAPLLPSWPREIDPWMIMADRKKTDWESKGVEDRQLEHRQGGHRHKKLRFNRPIFTTQGIGIYWANPLDAEFAGLWPRTIKHQPMGFSRHAAPTPPESPLHPWQQADQPEGERSPAVALDMSTFRKMQLSKRSKETAARREREQVLTRIKNDVLASIAGRPTQKDTPVHGQSEPESGEEEGRENRSETVV